MTASHEEAGPAPTRLPETTILPLAGGCSSAPSLPGFDDDDGFSGNHPCELVYPPAPPNANKIWDERVAKTIFAPQRKAPPTRPLAPPVEASASQRQAYAKAALEDELRTLSSAVEGTRNHQLFVSAAALRRFVREGDLGEAQVEGLLTQTAQAIGLTDDEIEKTIASARRKDDNSDNKVVLRDSDDWAGPVYQLELADDPLATGATSGTGLSSGSVTSDDEPWTPHYTDFAALLAGGLPEPPSPSVLHRADGAAIFYRGKRNELYGDPEGGKTMIAQAAAVGVLVDSGNVVFYDLDNNGAIETADRLQMLGAPRDALESSRFRHCEPEDAADLMRYVEDCAGWADLVIIDNVGELLPLLGANSDKADDYTRVVRAVTGPFITTGACVLLLDHLAKNHDSRAYGSGGTMAKRRAITGTSIEVRPLRQFVPGEGGSAELVINKDRPGGLRRHCPPGRGNGRRQSAGTFVLEPPSIPGESQVWRIAAPLAGIATTLDDQAAEYLRAASAIDGPFTVDDLAAAVGAETPPTAGQRDRARHNIDKLVDDGAVRVVRGGRRGRGGAGLWEVST